MIRKMFLVIVALVLTVLPLMSSGQSEESQTKDLVIWSFNLSPEALAKVNETIIPSFEAANPNVDVDWQNIPYKGYREKLLTAAAGKSLPDIFLDGFNMLGTYHNAGIIEDLSSRINSWEQWNDIPASLQDLTKYEGDIYGVPVRVKVYTVLINTKLFIENGLDPDNPPETWSEALAAAEKIVKVKNGVVEQMGSSGFYNTAAMVRGYDIFVQQNGGRFLDDDGNPAFNTERGIEALDFLAKLYRTQEPVGAAPPR